MTNDHADNPVSPDNRSRDLFLRSSLAVPASRLREKQRATAASNIERQRTEIAETKSGSAEYGVVKGALHQRLLDEINEQNMLGGNEEFLASAARDFVE